MSFCLEHFTITHIGHGASRTSKDVVLGRTGISAKFRTCDISFCSTFRAQVLDAVANVLGAPPASSDAPLMESGLDSLGAVELRNSLASRFGIELPPTVTLDYPSVAALAGFVASLVAPPKPRRGKRVRQLASFEAPGPQLLDIVGASCVYPGKLAVC